MNSMQVNFPVAPVEVMPAEIQNIALVVGSVGTAMCFALGVRLSLKYKTPLPLFFPIAGFFVTLLEPVICFLGHALHPQIGQITLFETSARPIPVHVALLYTIYYAPMWFILFQRLMTKGLDNRYLWKSFLFLFVFAEAFEFFPIRYGLWSFYGNHAWQLGEAGLPLFFPVVNLIPAYLGFALMLKYRQLLTGYKVILVIPLTQVAAYMAHFGAGFPYYNVLNSTAADSMLMVQLACVASIVLALCFVALINRSLVESAEQLKALRRIAL